MPKKGMSLLLGRPGNAWLAAVCLAAAAFLAALASFFWVYGDQTIGAFAALGAVLLCAAAMLLTAPLVAALITSRRFRWTAPVTKAGAGYIALLLLVAAAAIYSGSNLIYLVLSAMLAAMLVSGLVSRLDLSGLQLRLALPDHLFAGQPALARIAVRNLKRWMPSVGFKVCVVDEGADFALQDLYFPYLGPQEELSASSQATFSQRGRYRNGQVALETRFPFGFVTRRVKLRLNDEIVVYPSVEMTQDVARTLEELERQAQGRTRGDSHDLYRIRPAVSGDSARFVHWKATARSGDLWVREFARDDERRVKLVFDRRVPAFAAATEFERQVCLCAAVAWRLHESRAEVLFASDERVIRCGSEGAEIFDLLTYLALVQSAGPDGPPPPALRDDEATEHVFSISPRAGAPVFQA